MWESYIENMDQSDTMFLVWLGKWLMVAYKESDVLVFQSLRKT